MAFKNLAMHFFKISCCDIQNCDLKSEAGKAHICLHRCESNVTRLLDHQNIKQVANVCGENSTYR